MVSLFTLALFWQQISTSDYTDSRRPVDTLALSIRQQSSKKFDSNSLHAQMNNRRYDTIYDTYIAATSIWQQLSSRRLTHGTSLKQNGGSGRRTLSLNEPLHHNYFYYHYSSDARVTISFPVMTEPGQARLLISTITSRKELIRLSGSTGIRSLQVRLLLESCCKAQHF